MMFPPQRPEDGGDGLANLHLALVVTSASVILILSAWLCWVMADFPWSSAIRVLSS